LKNFRSSCDDPGYGQGKSGDCSGGKGRKDSRQFRPVAGELVLYGTWRLWEKGLAVRDIRCEWAV